MVQKPVLLHMMHGSVGASALNQTRTSSALSAAWARNTGHATTDAGRLIALLMLAAELSIAPRIHTEICDEVPQLHNAYYLSHEGHGSQDLEKKEAVAEKKRESIMVGLNQTKGQVAGLEAALARNQVDLEKAHFELDALKGAPQAPSLVVQHAELSTAWPHAGPSISDGHVCCILLACSAHLCAWGDMLVQ